MPPKASVVTVVQSKFDIPSLIAQEAKKYGIDVQLALTISYKESHWNVNAVGDHGESFGLFQIHLPDHPDVTEKEALNPYFNVEWSMKTMKKDDGCSEWSTCN